MKKLFICLYLLLTSSVGYSDINCFETAYGTECHAEVPEYRAMLDTLETGRQKGFNWCWAASIETVFHQWGYDVPQEQIVQTLFGNLDDKTARPEEILALLNHEWFDYSNGRSFRSHAKPTNMILAVKELENNKPVLLGYNNPQGPGHAVVLESIRYFDNGYGPQLLSASVSDPGYGQLRALTTKEVNNAFFYASVNLEETPTSSDIIFNEFEQKFSNFFPPTTNYNTQTTHYLEGNAYYRRYDKGRVLYAYQGEIHYNLGNGWQYFSTLQEANQYLCNNGCF